MNGLLREEARPRDREALTRSQLEALVKMVDILVAATEGLHNGRRHQERQPSDNRRGSGLDATRSSRIFFLSGDPGTGKTTVYLSLQRALQKLEQPVATESTEIPSQATEWNSSHRTLQKQLGRTLPKLQGRIEWLESLNLEAASEKTTNYLAAVLARIDRVLGDKLGGHDPKKRSRGGIFDLGDVKDVMAEFQRLRTDIGLAWGGTLPIRQEHLDPDVYAEEVMRAEDARVGINRRFHEVLESLTDEIYPGEQKRLFILPVDDMSLDAPASLELLHLLRMVSVPQLFVLAMGDTESFEELGFQTVLGSMIKLAGDSAFKLDHQQRTLPARAWQMARWAQRKLLPPGQQTRVQALYWDETLKLRFTSSSGSDDRLCELLERCKLPRLNFGSYREPIGAPERMTLLSFLGRPGNSKIDFDNASEPVINAVKNEDAYTALQILEVPYRNALDLWHATYDELSREDAPAKGDATTGVLSWAIDQTIRALDEQGHMLTLEDRVICEDAIQRKQYTELGRTLNTEKLLMSPSCGAPTVLKKNQKEPHFKCCTLEVATHLRWLLAPKQRTQEAEARIRGLLHRPGRRPQSRADQPATLPPVPTAWFILLHDLLILTPENGLAGPPLTPEWNRHRWAATHWIPTYSSPWDPREGDVSLPWPVPRWSTFWELDDFLAGWNAVVRTLTRQISNDSDKGGDLSLSNKGCRDELWGLLAYWWIRLASSVTELKRDPEIQKIQRVLSDDPDLAFDTVADKAGTWTPAANGSWEWWSNTIKKITSLEGTEAVLTGARVDIERWLVHLVVMMAPEYGLPKRVCETVLNGLGFPKRWETDEGAGQYVRSIRADNLIQFLFPRPEATGAEPRLRWEVKKCWKGLVREPGASQEGFEFGGEDHPFNEAQRLLEVESPNAGSDSKERVRLRWNPTEDDLEMADKRRSSETGADGR